MFAEDFIEEDISELKKIDLFSQGKAQKKINYDNNQFYILKNYPKTKKIIMKYFYRFIKTAFNYDIKWKMTTSWAVKLDKGDQVHQHLHRNSVWSSVLYYGAYTDKSCSLRFLNPIRDQQPINVFLPTTNPMVSDCAIKPETNKIIFFPSWIEHYSYANEEDTRYSLACNFIPTGNIGMADSQLII